MSDFLVELGSNKQARRMIRKLGLPLPLPQKLDRDRGPWQERPLADLPVVVSPAGGTLDAVLAGSLARAGADIWVAGRAGSLAVFEAQGEACGRPVKADGLSGDPGTLRPHALLYDATGLTHPAELKALYEFFHARVKSLRKCGRVIIIGLPPDKAKTPEAAAAFRAMEGFMRSLGREVGRKGITSQLLQVEPGSEERLEPLLRFLLSRRSAYVSGQPIRVHDRLKASPPFPVTRVLEQKVALVTGSSRGIGAATARALAREGARVIVMDRPSEDGPASILTGKIGGVLHLGDITDPEATESLLKLLDEKFDGHIDIIVHNAGVTRDKTLGNMKAELWEQTLGVNLLALIGLTGALEPKLRPGGRIICLSSIAGISGNMGQTNYSASKAGVIGYIEALAPKLARRGIAINAVAPGFIETKMTAAIPLATREVARRLCNLQQGGLPEDVAEVVTFLASPGSAGMTGEVLRICGGNFVGA